MSDNKIRLRIDVAYVGKNFHGWQIQSELRTVQGDLRSMASHLLGRPATPVGAGRTDAGVNAGGQVAHLTVDNEVEAERMMRVLPRLVPEDIEIRNVQKVSHDFNARFTAIARRYSFRIFLGRDLFQPYTWQMHWEPDFELMHVAAQSFLGTHDFSSFCKATSLKKNSNNCIVDRCGFEWSGQTAIFNVKANRFLHHMVRIMVGTLVEIGRGVRPADDIPKILAARERSAAGAMALPEGLFLEEVYYPECFMDPTYRDPKRWTGLTEESADNSQTEPEEGDPK